MQDPRGDAVRAFRELLAEAEDSPWHAIALAKESKEVERLAQRLPKLSEVSKVVTIQDFVPPDQEEKLLLIEEMALTTGPITISPRPEPAPGDVAARQRQALDALAAALDRFIKAHPDHSATATAAAVLRWYILNCAAILAIL